LDEPLKSVMQGQCSATPTGRFPVAGHHCRVPGTKLYCLLTEAHVCEQLVQVRYLTAEWLGVKLQPLELQAQ